MCFRPVSVGKPVLCPNQNCKKPNKPDAKACAFCGEKLPEPPKK